MPSPASHRRSLSYPPPAEQLYLNSILTTLPLTQVQSPVTSPGLASSSSAIWRDLAEKVYAELAESSPSLVNGPIKDVARAILKVMHGCKAPGFADMKWTARGGRYLDTRLLLGEAGAGKSGRTFQVVISGGGPVGQSNASPAQSC